MGVAGTVDFPTHMKDYHQDMMDNTGSIALTPTMFGLMNTAGVLTSGNPYYQKTAFDPDSNITDFMDEVDDFQALIDDFDPATAWEDFVATVVAKLDGSVFDIAYVDADINAYSDLLDEQLNNSVLPKFEAGMRDVGAAMSSAFAVGRALILGMKQRDVVKYGTDLRNKFHIQRNDSVVRTTNELSKAYLQKFDIWRSMVHYTIEANRIAIVAQKEENDSTTALAVGLSRWPFEVFMYGANLLAAIGGGTYIPNNIADAPSSGQTALGGALAGAAIGASVGGSTGAILGGLLGLGAAIL